jgi:hypothetical protein
MDQIPVFDKEIETHNEYLDRLTIYNNKQIQNKYNLILKFINKWIKSDMKSLTDFRYINEKTLFESPKYNREILKEFCPKFKTTFFIDTDINENTDDKDISTIMIITIFNKILSNINYRLILTQRTKNYSIKMK